MKSTASLQLETASKPADDYNREAVVIEFALLRSHLHSSPSKLRPKQYCRLTGCALRDRVSSASRRRSCVGSRGVMAIPAEGFSSRPEEDLAISYGVSQRQALGPDSRDRRRNCCAHCDR